MDEISGEIANNCGHFEYQHSSQQFACNLKKMKLRQIKRDTENATKCWETDKFIVAFQLTVQMGNLQFNVSLFNFSLSLFDFCRYSFQFKSIYVLIG